MAKEVVKKIKLQIDAGKATPAPPVGTVLGPAGINLGEFCTKFNEATRDKMGDVVPCEISIYDDRSFDFVLKTAPAAFLLKKEAKIVIGTRSAIFSPFTNLGIIIIDEEHSQTYKQDNTPRYNAIDVALYRGKRNNVPVIMGSATPSIESYTKAKVGTYKLLTLKNSNNKNRKNFRNLLFF